MSQWLPVSGFEDLYLISDCGLVKRYDRSPGRILKPVTTNKGYLRVMLSDGKIKKSAQVHRLVGKAFVSGESEGMQINHINGIKSDNRKENLEWVTASQNIQHAYDTGLNSGHCNAESISGRRGSSFKGLIEAREINGDRVFTMEGHKHFKACGFTPQTVYDCVNGKFSQHKGFRFKRVPLTEESESILLRAGEPS